MATRCCSARCSAERKGFRRELDSWRHKLIHCVGFESILEGIYGPRLLQDLSIFDNCEPEATADWSTDARCSFCNLQLEKISDHLPDSPPHAEPPPQGINTSDTLQCQADQFLHAVLHKKEFPESCDPIIPLAAQELMRKMIRQFAAEYAHKIQTAENQNAITQTEPDGPLDLTLSRSTQCAQDGVLDLSKKNTTSLNTLAQQRLSGVLETKKEECRTKEGEEEQKRRGTVLEEVMMSLCAHHRVLLLHILQEMTSFRPKDEHGGLETLKDVHGTAGTQRSAHGGHCCHSDESLCVLSSCVAAGCVCQCRIGVCGLRSMCPPVKSCSSFSCRSITLGCAGCCARSQILVCQHTHSSDITHVAQTGSITLSRCHSPSPPPLSPPPLSPKPQDAENNFDLDMPTLNTHTQNTQPPPLLPHNTHTEQTPAPETTAKPEHLIDLMDKFTDTLMEASEREWSMHTHTGDSVKACDDTHLTEIITTVLHSSSEKDYNLKELFEQRLASEKRSPQTRSQRRQEVMQAISRSHDQPKTRRQHLQSKRDLARLKLEITRKKKRRTHPITHVTHNQSPDTPSSRTQSPNTPISPTNHPVTPISPTNHPDTPILLTLSPGTPISHTYSSDMSISPTNHPDTPISLTHSPDTPISLTQIPETPTSNAQSPDIVISQAQAPDKIISQAQGPDTPIYQSPYRRISTPSTHKQTPDTPKSLNQTSDSPNLIVESPDKTDSQIQIQDTARAYTQSPDTPNAQSNKETCTEETEPCSTVRTRRNIVRPQRWSSYVTEPRKMYYTACRSAKTNSTPTLATDMTSPPPSAVTEELKTPPVSPKKNKVCKDENSKEAHVERQLRVKTRSEDKTRTPSPVVTDATDTDDPKYVSPIKLMLVSTVKDEDGVKYTIRSAQPHNGEESFDPCVESSWAGNKIKEQAKNESIQTMSVECTDKRSTEESANIEGPSNSANIVDETEPTIKRRPGRPKKLKILTEKAVKRPIGRPRKSKLVDTNGVPSEDTEKQSGEDLSTGEDGNKNLKITITYGRRKARRMVCEGQVPTEESKGSEALAQSGNAEENVQSTQAQASMRKDQFSLVMPVEDRRNLTHAIMCPKQNDGAGTRRPGRPAKVKISGISVTVTTVSPRQRKIHMRRDTREPAVQRRALLTEMEPNEEQATITNETQASVRHSVRERRPSVHLLQCVAMSRSNTLTPRSRKQLLYNANMTQQHEPKDAKDTKTIPNTSPQNTVHFSATSVESLFNANLQWWPTSASPDKIKEEMNRRLKVMKETWVSDTKDLTTPDDNSSAPSSSAVRMLFERDCSMETLCSWFMQTTETQSLAIVKKANNRNPCEVFQYNSGQSSDRPNVCSSPQAERLRKCVKKFATVVPKSPTKLQQAQAKIHGAQTGFPKQPIFNTTNNTEKSQQCRAWHFYRTALDRARSRFKSRTKSTNIDYKSLNEQKESEVQPVSVSEHGLLNTVQSESRRTSTQQKQITTNAWNAHTLKECKVFLRKLNNVDPCSLSEKSNNCTVRSIRSPAVGESVRHQKQGVGKSIKLEKTPPNRGPSTRQQSKGNRKRKYNHTNVLPQSQKQQRISRGVMAAKWSDFILDPGYYTPMISKDKNNFFNFITHYLK
ncbi:uncharacterized protein lcorl isoform 2-T2 [Clarias gariepinus]